MFFSLPSGHQWTNSPGWYPVSTKLACFPPARMTIPSGDWMGWDCQVRPTIGLLRHRLCLKGDIRDLCDINHNDPWLTFLILPFWDHCQGFTTIYKQAALSKSLLEFLNPMPARLIMTSHAHTLLSYTTFLNQGHQVDRSTWGEKSSTSDRLSFVVILMAPKKETAPPGYPFSISHAKVENVTIGTGDYMFPRQPTAWKFGSTVTFFAALEVAGCRSLQQGQFRSVWEQLTAQGTGGTEPSRFFFWVTKGSVLNVFPESHHIFPETCFWLCFPSYVLPNRHRSDAEAQFELQDVAWQIDKSAVFNVEVWTIKLRLESGVDWIIATLNMLLGSWLVTCQPQREN